MKPLYLYTEEFFFRYRIKRLVKRLLGRGFGGPLAVEQSLRSGLTQLGVPFVLNRLPESGAVAGVLNGVQTLRWAVAQKKRGVFSKLLAGPNIVVLPHDAGGVLRDPAIDSVIVPSLWVQKAYERDAAELAGKIYPWTAGVTIPENFNSAKKNIDFLILNKISPSLLARELCAYLRNAGYKVSLIEYGAFSQNKYFELLEQSRSLVYIGRTESQGLAMFEAWARNVPTLAYGQHDATGNTPSPSPYLTSSCGLFFKDMEHFKAVLPQFLQTEFSPRQFVESSFTFKKSAEAYARLAEDN